MMNKLDPILICNNNGETRTKAIFLRWYEGDYYEGSDLCNGLCIVARIVSSGRITVVRAERVICG